MSALKILLFSLSYYYFTFSVLSAIWRHIIRRFISIKGLDFRVFLAYNTRSHDILGFDPCTIQCEPIHFAGRQCCATVSFLLDSSEADPRAILTTLPPLSLEMLSTMGQVLQRDFHIWHNLGKSCGTSLCCVHFDSEVTRQKLELDSDSRCLTYHYSAALYADMSPVQTHRLYSNFSPHWNTVRPDLGPHDKFPATKPGLQALPVGLNFHAPLKTFIPPSPPRGSSPGSSIVTSPSPLQLELSHPSSVAAAQRRNRLSRFDPGVSCRSRH